MNDSEPDEGLPTLNDLKPAASPRHSMLMGKSMAKPKHAGGRPPKFKTPQEMQAAVDEYFNSCWVDKITETENKESGEIITSNVRYQNRPYTIAGLALGLGFLDRQSLYDNEQRGDEFSCVIKKARITVEMNVEEMALWNKNAAGPIFWLKNHSGYRDKQEIESSGELTINLVSFADNKHPK